MRLSRNWVVVAGVAALASGGPAAYFQEYKSGVVWPEPAVVAPGATAADPPGDAIVLFDGKEESKAMWKEAGGWEIQNGIGIIKNRNGLNTKQAFGDCQVHVEFATPEKVSGSGQGRGNSGVYLMGKYEVQILDSWVNNTYFDGQCAAIYKQHPPMVNVCRKPGEWQTYDILFEAPHFAADGKVLKPGYVTVLQNGVCVQNHFELQGGTYYDQPAHYDAKGHPAKLPLYLQYHGNPVKFRNIWIREMKPIEGKKPEKK
ncbi:MAG TPA: DUF1080 domain-containing protein [Fimbriiglobus sp.]|jgi:hypothetical protein